MIATDTSDAFALSALRSEHWDALRSQADERLEFSVKTVTDIYIGDRVAR